MKKLNRNKIIVLAAVNLFMLLVLIGCVLECRSISNELLSQQAAETWKGESKTDFSQVSVYFPEYLKAGTAEIDGFRKQIDLKISEAFTSVKGSETLNDENEIPKNLWADTFYEFSDISVEGERGTFPAKAVGVEGNFFLFHPYELLSGSYLSDSDIMKDRVVLDYDLAWKLFGGSDLEGMKIKIGEKYYYVAGVIKREDDKFTEKAYLGEPMIFMFHSALSEISGGEEGLKVSGYEIVMAEPITNFTYNFVEENFGDSAMVVSNSKRYGFKNIFSMFKNFGDRSMKTDGVICPYWENAARVSEDYYARLCFVAFMALIVPAITLITFIVLLLIFVFKLMKNEMLKLHEAWDDRYGIMEERKRLRAEKKSKTQKKAKIPKKRKDKSEKVVDKQEETFDEYDDYQVSKDVESIVRDFMNQNDENK